VRIGDDDASQVHNILDLVEVELGPFLEASLRLVDSLRRGTCMESAGEMDVLTSSLARHHLSRDFYKCQAFLSCCTRKHQKGSLQSLCGGRFVDSSAG